MEGRSQIFLLSSLMQPLWYYPHLCPIVTPFRIMLCWNVIWIANIIRSIILMILCVRLYGFCFFSVPFIYCEIICSGFLVFDIVNFVSLWQKICFLLAIHFYVQLTNHTHNLLLTLLYGNLLFLLHRKTLLLATGILVAGGTAAYVQSRFNCRKPGSYQNHNGLNDNIEKSEEVVRDDNNVKKTPKKKGGLKSIQVLAAVLLSEMGKMGARDLLSLVAIVVSPFFLYIWVQGLMCFCCYFLIALFKTIIFLLGTSVYISEPWQFK